MHKRIAHIDMDAFFVSIERRDNPGLIGRPVVVGGDGSRGVVCSASYEARVYGIHSGMPSARARQLCPEVIFVRTSSDKYSEASRQVRDVIGQYSPDVDFTSVDEGYFDLTGTQRLFGRPLDVVEQVRREVLERTGCSSSLGISRSRLCSKVASNFAKPGGIIEVTPEREREFLEPLPLKLLPGAGGKLGERLAGFGVTRIGQLITVGEQFLKQSFGMAGTDLYLKANGGIAAPRKTYRDLPRKSVGHERTFGEDTTDFAFLERVLFRLAERCCRTLRDEGMVSRCVTLKVRLADFRTFTRSHTLLSATDCDIEVFREVRGLLREFNLPRVAVRLVGVSLSSLSAECQWGLFSSAARLWRLYQGIDRIRDVYGFDSVVSGMVIGDESTARYQGKMMNPFHGPRFTG
jgi:DNA polymerase-4